MIQKCLSAHDVNVLHCPDFRQDQPNHLRSFELSSELFKLFWVINIDNILMRFGILSFGSLCFSAQKYAYLVIKTWAQATCDFTFWEEILKIEFFLSTSNCLNVQRFFIRDVNQVSNERVIRISIFSYF